MMAMVLVAAFFLSKKGFTQEEFPSQYFLSRGETAPLCEEKKTQYCKEYIVFNGMIAGQVILTVHIGHSDNLYILAPGEQEFRIKDWDFQVLEIPNFYNLQLWKKRRK